MSRLARPHLPVAGERRSWSGRGSVGLVAAVAALLAMTLAGCTSSGKPPSATASARTTVDAAADLSRITVKAGVTGAAPTVDVPAPLAVTSTARQVLTMGTGAAASAGSAVVARFVGVNARTGKVFASDFDSAPVSFELGDAIIKGFSKALEGVPAGSRVLAAVSPADGYGPAGGVKDLGIAKDDSLVYVIDVLAAVPARAQGTPVKPKPRLPTVTLAASGEPTITVPAGVSPSATLVSQPLQVGAGPAVTKGQYVTVQYTGVIYGSGKVFDASWSKQTPATFQIGVGNVIPGWDTALVGASVGSQLLLVIPPAQGYGPSGNSQAGISGTDTLVFVVDVLAATS